MEFNENHFAEILRNLRKEAGLSQEELAFRCGLDRTYISMLETNKRMPTITSLFKISQAIGIFPSELVKLVEEKQKFQPPSEIEKGEDQLSR